jgi:hypothetical protein
VCRSFSFLKPLHRHSFRPHSPGCSDSRWRSEQNPSKDDSQAQSLLERDARKIETLRISWLSLHCSSRRCAVDDQELYLAIRRVAEKVRPSHMQTQRCENGRDRRVADMTKILSVLAILANASDRDSRQR